MDNEIKILLGLSESPCYMFLLVVERALQVKYASALEASCYLLILVIYPLSLEKFTNQYNTSDLLNVLNLNFRLSNLIFPWKTDLDVTLPLVIV